jgi:hypothetical protein
MAMAFSPLNLITPIAPMPGGVASATIVSFQPDNFILMIKSKGDQNKNPFTSGKGICKFYY